VALVIRALIAKELPPSVPPSLNSERLLAEVCDVGLC